jgi:hypothetical protein
MVAGPFGRAPLCGHRNRDDAKPEHRESHEFEHQGVHNNIPYNTVKFVRGALILS